MFKITMLSLLLGLTTYAQPRTPVLVELFTSEGCSSCPPADQLLADLAAAQPVRAADLIVLSEHVDYWNSLGWKDPFSAQTFSDRQQSYASMLGGDVYTPQVVVDGHWAAVGSRRQQIIKAVADAGETAKPDLRIAATLEAGTVQVELTGAGRGDVWLAVAQDKAVSRVAHGENGGRTLQHVAVVRVFKKISGNHARLQVDKGWGNLSVVAFVQDPHSGRILQLARTSI